VTLLHRRDMWVGLASLTCLPRFALGSSTTPVHDLMPAFWQSYDAVAARPVDEQSTALLTGFFQPHKAVYERAGLKTIDRGSVARWLAKVVDLIPDMRRLHQRFAGDYRLYVQRFERAFPDFDRAASPIFFMPSLLHFDGHLELSQGEVPLFFGIDGIVRYHGPNPDLGVLFAHETFHCYQAQQNPTVAHAESTPLYVTLWSEGGATWVSERLNPRASQLNVLLDDRALAMTTPEQLRAAAAALLTKLDSTDEADMKPFFSAGWSGPWPARVGYLIGLQIARRVGGHTSIRHFVRLSPAGMRTLYTRELSRLTAPPRAAAAHRATDLPADCAPGRRGSRGSS
jgi:hypothetical protein